MLLCSRGLKKNPKRALFFPCSWDGGHGKLYIILCLRNFLSKPVLLQRHLYVENNKDRVPHVSRWWNHTLACRHELKWSNNGTETELAALLSSVSVAASLCWEESTAPLFPITTPSHSDVHFPELTSFLFGLGWRRGAYEIDRRQALISDWSVEQ